MMVERNALVTAAEVVLGAPDAVAIATDAGFRSAEAGAEGWQRDGVVVTLQRERGTSSVLVRAEETVSRVWLRWRHRMPADLLVLGDAWERSYGDLGWRGIDGQRPLPWYTVLTGHGGSVGIGVRTRPAAWCSFAVDGEGIGLLIDLRAGASPLRPRDRVITAAVIDAVTGDDPYDTAVDLCRRLCPDPVLPSAPVYGGNNWYHAYGRSSADAMVAEADFHAGLSDHAVRPFTVIDDGWQPLASADYNGGPWDGGNTRFGDMAALTARIADTGSVPGIWCRPLLAREGSPEPPLRSAAGGVIADPSRPEVLARVAADVERLVGWGHRLIKHDFTTFDVTGRWGPAMGWNPVGADLRFADDTRTTVEVLDGLYATIAEAARRASPTAMVLGCNTVGHLAAGRFAVHRTGDDTSGMDFARTRVMGVNTLAFRLPQHGTFHAVDADCVGVTDAIDWVQNRAWLDLVARSGTALFVSVDPATVTAEQRRDLAEAYAIAAAAPATGRPLDWLSDTTPRRWSLADGTADYSWHGGTATPMLA